MRKIKAFPTRLTLWAINCRLWLLLRYSLYHRKACLYRSAGLFWRISRLTRQRKLLEQRLAILQRGGTI